MISTPQVRTDLFQRKLEKVLVTDFFGSVRNIELLNKTSDEGSNQRQSEVPVTKYHHDKNLPPGHLLSPRDSLVRNSNLCKLLDPKLVT